MTRTADALPPYLRRYVATQNYDAYTSRDHASWRFIMRQNREFFRKAAVPVYLEGLEKTGIPVDRIPRIEEMDAKLQAIGWGAVAVEGFIPSPAFLEFQARGILPIAVDMRTTEHIAYTPAPDIVHEAAGHAPVIADPEYAAYLKQYARMAQKAIASREDIDLYEAIRTLSDLKENPDVPPAEVARAEESFSRVSKALSEVSEAGQMARMAWWTVEYGLVGDLKSPRIYGAGLLSSVGESQHCLSDRVRKIPLTVDCVNQTYDITEPQPQLFVARDQQHLVEVLADFEKTLAFVHGGPSGLGKAVRARTVNTVVLGSGLQLSGLLESFESAEGRVDFLKFSGPVQLARGDRELPNHGRERHPGGFSSPIGQWADFPGRDPSQLSDAELSRAGLAVGRRFRLEFMSGFAVEGLVKGWVRGAGNGLLETLTFADCTVARGSWMTFDPSWGEFDLAIGDQVSSVFAGPADREAYGTFDMGQASTRPGRTSPHTPEEIRVFDLYARVRSVREQAASGPQVESELRRIAEKLEREHPSEWLLAVEILEAARQKLGIGAEKADWLHPLGRLLDRAGGRDPAIAELVQKGVALAAVI
ncbi:MAG: aromatic amino acid hydroxylase [Bdellovibrionales bacterium]|nr:aromatic amino acid hydroxylase [Bdellovibrionales bacterium]